MRAERQLRRLRAGKRGRAVLRGQNEQQKYERDVKQHDNLLAGYQLHLESAARRREAGLPVPWRWPRLW